jgi:hypothetical protein
MCVCKHKNNEYTWRRMAHAQASVSRYLLNFIRGGAVTHPWKIRGAATHPAPAALAQLSPHSSLDLLFLLHSMMILLQPNKKGESHVDSNQTPIAQHQPCLSAEQCEVSE